MIGFALCGSFCTIRSALTQLARLTELYEVQGIVSEAVFQTDTRFAPAATVLEELRHLTGKNLIHTVVEAVTVTVSHALFKFRHVIDTVGTVDAVAIQHFLLERADLQIRAVVAGPGAVTVKLTAIKISEGEICAAVQTHTGTFRFIEPLVT